MSTSRISSTASQAHSSRTRDKNKLKIHRFMGLALGGGKNDRTALSVLEYYPGQNKLFLTHVYEHIQQEDELSGDQVLFEIIDEHKGGLEYLSLNAPLKFPKCVRCRLACPGYERCKEKEIVWMWKQHRKRKKEKKRARLFTPYTQRAAEMFIASELEEGLHPLEALGANIAPLAARAHFLLRRLPKVRVIESYPPLSVLRIGQTLKLNKNNLGHYKHQVGGDECRQSLLEALLKRDIVFIYQQDFHKLIENHNSFDSFIAAFTGFLKYKDQCEKVPKDFPIEDGWIDFPVRNPELF